MQGPHVLAAALAALRRHWLAMLLAVLAAAAALAAAAFRLDPRVPADAVARRDLVQSVVASGHVEAPHRTDIGVQITGTVRAVPVAEGQAVAAGTVLIQLDDAELKAALAQADLAVTQAQARLRQLRELQAPTAQQALQQAQVNYETAQRTLARNRELFQREFIGQAALDEAMRAEQVALAQLRTAEQQLASVRPGGSDVAAAEAALRAAEAGAQMARARLAYATVRAPSAGTLIARNVEPGDVVQAGKALMVLAPSGETQLVLAIDEKNLGLLHTVQHALASAHAFPRHLFPP